jgi:oligopeptide/dipeptide ABC transporter ATP-binding protein
MSDEPVNSGDASLLDVSGLTVEIPTPRGTIRPIDNISFRLEKGDLLAIVGESGSGKTLTGLSLLGLLPGEARVVGGSIRFRGEDVTRLSEDRWNKVRGSRISMVFQEPQSALNPILTIGTQFREIFDSHTPGMEPGKRDRRILDLLASVGLPQPASILRSFPHQLSGGMRQRVLIAMAITLTPDIVIADEPTTALDVTMAGQILSLLMERNERDKTALVLISHDLGIVRRSARRILVLYAGRLVETVSGDRFFKEGPSHPYSRALLLSRPSAGHSTKADGPLLAIRGQVPPLWELPTGCGFAPRCPKADERCFRETPPWITTGSEEAALCFYPEIPEGSEDAA